MSDSLPATHSRHITICGLMAAGKSNTGKILAAGLGRPFFDLDQVIEEGENRSITGIFASEGESGFRKMEWACLSRLLKGEPAVIALGGGALQNEEILTAVKQNSLLVYLDVPLEEIARRVAGDRTRPLLLKKDGSLRSNDELIMYFKDLRAEREKLYKQAHLHLKIKSSWNNRVIAGKILDYVRTA